MKQEKTSKRTVQKFEQDFLNGLVEDENSCVETKELTYHLALHPFHLNNINQSLKDILNKKIARYDKTLDGILLGYQNIKLLSPVGAINDDSFFIHLDIAASFFLFKPEVGKILPGVINKKSNDHIGCLVHQIFNVSIPRSEEESGSNHWVGSKLEIGQEILFKITFLNLESRLPYIRAEFISTVGEQDSGISTGEDDKRNTKIVFKSDSEENDNTYKKKKKKKHKKERVNDETVDDNQLINVSNIKVEPNYGEENVHHKKKRKRERIPEIEEEVVERKHKKRKIKQEVEDYVEDYDSFAQVDEDNIVKKKKKKKSREIIKNDYDQDI